MNGKVDFYGATYSKELLTRYLKGTDRDMSIENGATLIPHTMKRLMTTGRPLPGNPAGANYSVHGIKMAMWPMVDELKKHGWAYGTYELSTFATQRGYETYSDMLVCSLLSPKE